MHVENVVVWTMHHIQWTKIIIHKVKKYGGKEQMWCNSNCGWNWGHKIIVPGREKSTDLGLKKLWSSFVPSAYVFIIWIW